MPPKKDDKKKPGLPVPGGPTFVTITEEELNEAQNLPQIRDYVFTNLLAFKMIRNQSRLNAAIKKHFSYINPEEPGYSEELNAKYKTVDLKQLIGQAQSRGLLTEQEAAEFSKGSNIPPLRRRQILAQATKESVTAFQLPLMRAKRDKGLVPQQSSALGTNAQGESGENTRENTPKMEIEQFIYLQDFPQSFEDFQELINVGFAKINCINIIEEIFNREIEDENDDVHPDFDPQLKPIQRIDNDGNPLPAIIPEKLFIRKSDRVQVFENCVSINRFLKTQPPGSELRDCLVQRIKFQGPQDPMYLPPPPEEGQEPEPVDEQRKASELKTYQDFAKSHFQMILEVSDCLMEFKQTKIILKDKAVPLWEVKLTAEQIQRKKEIEEARAREEERKKKEEEDRRAAEAAAAAAAKKGGKPPPPQKTASPVQQQPPTEDVASLHLEHVDLPNYKSIDEDPSRLKEFNEFKKVMSEMSTGSSTVGSILGAMIYQISVNKEKIHQEALKAKPPMSKKDMMKKLLSKKESIQIEKQMQIENKIVDNLFDEVMQGLSIDYCIKETDFKHIFSPDNTSSSESPYLSVQDENHKVKTGKDVYILPDGIMQGECESKTLVLQQLPGVNKRLGMPREAAMKQAVREAEQNAIIQFCNLPTEQTKRCLILKQFEKMMLKNQPEQSFNFLDRNYVEEFNSADVMRQVLSSTMTEIEPDIVTEYYDKLDALLVSMYFKNPPGRLIRNQWTYPVSCLPDFQDWKTFIKEDEIELSKKLIDITNDKLGVLRSNFKVCFPSDNSIIKVNKHNIGQRRHGDSMVIKDNFTFGIYEQKQRFRTKVQIEDYLRNRDAKDKLNKNCDFWLKFENGVRMYVEMQDHQEPDMTQIPKPDIPRWLKQKMEREAQKQRELEEASESQQTNEKWNPINEAVKGLDSSLQQHRIVESEIINEHAIDSRQNPPTLGSNLDAMSKNKISTQGSKVELSNANQQSKTALEPEMGSAVRVQSLTNLQQENSMMKQEEIIESDDFETTDPLMFIEKTDMTSGAKLSFTFNEGLVIQIMPNGDVVQQITNQTPMPKSQMKGNQFVQDQLPDSMIETKRIITFEGQIIKYMADGNIILYFQDGSITYTDIKKKTWCTINPKGIKRVRRVNDGIVSDEFQRLEIVTKIDPETNATLKIREDKVLQVEYVDSTSYLIMPDGTKIVKQKREDGESGTVTYITQEGYVPVRQIYDPVKARAKTIIGLGGTDALMGKDNIMERSNSGKISEVLLPDNTCVQTYQEKQELPGYNSFSLNMIHLIRRADFSIVKVVQNGEIVLITANERSYLNSIGKQIPEFGYKDYDFFFELYGVPSERRSGVYTANLDKGRLWTQDEEGNYFLVYANGDSVEKMSVSFDLDQLVEGIENKEPCSPRIKDGEYIENECKFLPPPKSMAHPRLFFIRNDGTGMELCNEEQITHLFRTNANNNSTGFIKRQSKVQIQNEDCIKHTFITKLESQFNAQAYSVSHKFPKLPQCLELVNQTVSIPSEPVKEKFTIKTVLEFVPMNDQMRNEFHSALNKYHDLRAKETQRQEELRIEEPTIILVPNSIQPEKKDRFRGSNFDGQSTLQGSNMSDPGSDIQSIGSGNRRLNRSLTRQLKKQQAEDQSKATNDDKLQIEEEDAFDPISGQMKVHMQSTLNTMQKLQMRIAKERNINIEDLKGDEYNPLKQYQQSQQREKAFNNLFDFLQQ